MMKTRDWAAVFAILLLALMFATFASTVHAGGTHKNQGQHQGQVERCEAAVVK